MLSGFIIPLSLPVERVVSSQSVPESTRRVSCSWVMSTCSLQSMLLMTAVMSTSLISRRSTDNLVGMVLTFQHLNLRVAFLKKNSLLPGTRFTLCETVLLELLSRGSPSCPVRYNDLSQQSLVPYSTPIKLGLSLVGSSLPGCVVTVSHAVVTHETGVHVLLIQGKGKT